jgi:hypothetical protein
MTAQKITKNAKGYGYKYADLSEVNEYISSLGETYYQYTETQFNTVTGEPIDYIWTVRVKDGKETKLRGCRVITAELANKSNSAQEQGSGLTYARRYSLYMAYGLATEDDDAQILDRPKKYENRAETGNGINFEDYREKVSKMDLDELRKEYVQVKTYQGWSAKQKEIAIKIINDVKEGLSDGED